MKTVGEFIQTLNNELQMLEGTSVKNLHRRIKEVISKYVVKPLKFNENIDNCTIYVNGRNMDCDIRVFSFNTNANINTYIVKAIKMNNIYNLDDSLYINDIDSYVNKIEATNKLNDANMHIDDLNEQLDFYISLRYEANKTLNELK